MVTVAVVVVLSVLAILAILFWPRRSPYARRVASARNGRPYRVDREQF